jgi:acyl-CoA thioester hydrolase
VCESRVSEVFRQQLVVSHGDFDQLGHASNVAYVRWLQDVAQAHSERVGLGYSDYQRLGAVFVVRRHEIDYLRSALAGDSVELETWVQSWSAATSVRRTRIWRDGAELARAATTWAFVEAASGRPRRIPEPVRAAFAPRKDDDGAPAQ